MARPVPARIAAPLFAWRENAAIARLEAERDALTARIQTLPRRSYKRIVLEARLAELTARQLEAERALQAGEAIQ